MHELDAGRELDVRRRRHSRTDPRWRGVRIGRRRLPPDEIRWLATSGIIWTSEPVRDRIIALTRSMPPATRATRSARLASGSGLLSSIGTTTPKTSRPPASLRQPGAARSTASVTPHRMRPVALQHAPCRKVYRAAVPGMADARGEVVMTELIRSNDVVLIGFAQSLLEVAAIPALVADQHMSLLEGSIGAFARRLLVPRRPSRCRPAASSPMRASRTSCAMPESVSPDLWLGGRLRLHQPPRGAHRAGTDAVLLASLMAPGPGDVVCDVGAGERARSASPSRSAVPTAAWCWWSANRSSPTSPAGTRRQNGLADARDGHRGGRAGTGAATACRRAGPRPRRPRPDQSAILRAGPAPDLARRGEGRAPMTWRKAGSMPGCGPASTCCVRRAGSA